MDNFIESQWENFRKRVIPSDAPVDQLKEMKVAFYAGVILVYHCVEVLGEAEISEYTAVKVLESLRKEIEAYKKEMSS